MSDLKQHTEQFLKRGTEQLQKRQKEALTKINDNIEALNRLIKTRDDSAAMADWDTELEAPISSIAPEYFRYGSLQMVNTQGKVLDKLNIPLLLPTKVNAVMMNLGDDAEKVPNLFQNIIVRLLLSTRMSLAKVSVVDMDYGRSFPIVSSITNSMFKSQMFYRQDDVTQLIAGLAREISEVNRVFSGRYPDIDSYNASAGEMAQPYHFVFIDDFPNGFTSQAIDDLLRLIDNGNAASVGIKIFINYSTKNPTPRDFDIQRFKKPCAWISKGNDGKLSFDNWNQKFPPNVIPTIDLDSPKNIGDYVDFLNGMKQREIVYSLDGWIEDLKKKDLVWSGNTSDGIKVPIGYISSTKTFDFYLANDNDGSCNDFFALIAGRPGYGKTVLLHNIIVNAAMKYSPDELCFYLADFAEGASFSIYKKLPHVKSLMLSNNKEYALRMLNDLVLEAKKRSHLFQKAQREKGKQVTNLASYREVTGDKLPRIVFVMDEFHYLFLSTDPTTIAAKEALCNGIRQWRKFGISIILCTQSISGVNFGDADKQITYRFALNLLDMDSKTVIRNDSAKSLTRKGQTIMNNTADGNVSMNVEFQSAFTKHYLDHVDYLAKLYEHKYGNKHRPYICESGTDADIADNLKIYDSIAAITFAKNPQYCDVYVGKPDLLRDTHTRIRYQRRQNSNTLIVGDDFKTMIYDLMVQMVQLQGYSNPKSKIYVLDCFNAGDEYQGALKGMQDVSEVFTTGTAQNTTQYIDEISAELERRKAEQKEGKMTEERIVLAIMNAQNCYELKPQPGKFGVEPSVAAKKLATLLAEGGPLGIHCIVHCLSYETMFKTNGVLTSKEFPLFENMILLKGADVANMFLGGLKVAPPEESGLMIVLNGKADGEAYEQCKAYSDITATGKKNSVVEFMSNLFEKYRYA